MDNMNFNLYPEMVQLLCYQRSQYCSYISQSFQKEMNDCFDNIAPHLPGRLNSVLDIGAGIAGIDVILGCKYRHAQITLLDKNEYVDDFKGKIGFHKSADTFGGYCNLDHAEKLLSQNGIVAKYIDINKQPFPNGQFDLIVSFLSWGFHYPLKTYAKQIKCPCTVIADVRKGTDDGSLGKGEVIFTSTKYERKVFCLQ